MNIPWQDLSDDALVGVIEDFVTREGTEYGSRDYSLEEKIEMVKKQLISGKAAIVFDPELDSCTIQAVD